MKSGRIILLLCCFACICIFFIYHAFKTRNTLEDIKAPVYINIEIDKNFMNDVYILAILERSEKQFTLFSGNTDTQTVILTASSDVGNATPNFIRKLFLQVPKNNSNNIINSIKGISIFIGNKTFYYSQSDINNFNITENADSFLYEFHGLEYSKSFLLKLLNKKQWINWYGDINFLLKTFFNFILFPNAFIITWIFLIIFYGHGINYKYHAITIQENKVKFEFILLFFIVFLGLILRLNGYVRFSSWGDELASACISSNPNMPFLASFEDPGNPPFYYIILRLWFILFGWNEQSGNLLSVITGTAAIISLYFLVKQFSDKKTAYLAASYMAVSSYFISYSHDIRCHTLVLLLISIVAHRFFLLINKKEINIKDYICYAIPSILLVNTHYYGCLFIFANFLFFVIHKIMLKSFNIKKAFTFFILNIIIALSLLPYFLYTAFDKALFDSDFNSYMTKPEFPMFLIALIIIFSIILYIYLRNNFIKNTFSSSQYYFLDYILFSLCFIFIIAFIISFFRPIMRMRYLVILAPFIITFISIIIVKLTSHNSYFIRFFCISIILLLLASAYNENNKDKSSVYKEALIYINNESSKNPQYKSKQIAYYTWNNNFYDDFYGYNDIPLYTIGDDYDILYISPGISGEENMNMHLITKKLMINQNKILRIYINKDKYIFKIYFNDL